MALTASLDTNVLVRLLVKDDILQTQAALTLLAQYVQRSETLFVPVSVWLELAWVLRYCYQFGKADVILALSSLLATVELIFESEEALEQSLVSYEEGHADYADCLHLALAHHRHALPFLTFDVCASHVKGAKLVT